MITVVLGMHKSGTTLVSQILHHSGIDMVERCDESVSYDKGNQYERQAVYELNMEILGTEDDRAIRTMKPSDLEATPAQRERMRAIVADCGASHEHWGFKDPRCCLTYPLWAPELPPHRIVGVFRDPLEVWAHFKWRGGRRYLSNLWRGYRYLRDWAEHNDGVRAAFRAADRPALMLAYGELMTTDAEFARLEAFLDRDLDDRRRPDLYRNRPQSDPFIRLGRTLFELRAGRSLERMMADLDALRS